MSSIQRRSLLIVLSIVCFLILLLHTPPMALRAATPESAGKWAGVDEAVVGKIAAEHGRKPAKPLIDTDKGDLLLFVFLLAGTLGGFVGGYYWRKLVEQRAGSMKGERSA